MFGGVASKHGGPTGAGACRAGSGCRFLLRSFIRGVVDNSQRLEWTPSRPSASENLGPRVDAFLLEHPHCRVRVRIARVELDPGAPSQNECDEIGELNSPASLRSDEVDVVDEPVQRDRSLRRFADGTAIGAKSSLPRYSPRGVVVGAIWARELSRAVMSRIRSSRISTAAT